MPIAGVRNSTLLPETLTIQSMLQHEIRDAVKSAAGTERHGNNAGRNSKSRRGYSRSQHIIHPVGHRPVAKNDAGKLVLRDAQPHQTRGEQYERPGVKQLAPSAALTLPPKATSLSEFHAHNKQLDKTPPSQESLQQWIFSGAASLKV